MRETFFKKISNILNKKLLQGAKFLAEKKLQRRGKKFVMWAAAAAEEAEGIKQSVAISESDHHDEWWFFAFARNQKLHSSESCVKENLGIDRPQWRHQCINVSLAALGSVVEWNWASINQDS